MSITTDLLVKLINDPRYSRDPEFRQVVQEKVAEGVTHGGRTSGTGTDGHVIDFGKRGAAHSAGGFSVKSGSDRRGTDGHLLESDVRQVSIDDTATYHGPLNSAHEIAQAFSNPEYSRNPAYREQVAAALQQMEPTNRPKF